MIVADFRTVTFIVSPLIVMLYAQIKKLLDIIDGKN